MKHIVRLFLMSIIIGVVLWLAGCTEETKSPVAPSTPSTEIKTIQPKGFITGKIIDRCTGMAINGAVVSLGYGDTVHSVRSDASGSFAFANVPAGEYKTCPSCSVWTGTYMITASMVEYNARQTDLTKRYRDYFYQNVTIGFTSLVPGDSLGVSGLVGSVVCTLATLSTTLKGTVVNQDMLPAVNAGVTILDHFTSFVLAQTTTGADGSFQVPYLENGSFFEIRAKSVDGGLEGWAVKSVLCNQSTDSLRAQVTVEQIVLAPVDDVAPFVISVSPVNNADVAVGVSIVYTFSEPIKQVPYTVTTLGKGHGTIVDNIHVNYVGLKKAAADVPMTSVAWSNNNTVLTIVPSGIVGSAKYSARIDLLSNLTDIAGNAVVNNTTLVGDFEALNFTTAGGSTALAAPTVTRRTIQGLYGSLDYSGGTVGLEWSSVANARSYNVYRSIGNGPFELLHTNVYSLVDEDNTGSLCIPSTSNDPLSAISVRYQVRTVNADLVEGTSSNTISVSDAVSPTLGSVAIAGGTYTLRFSEPLNISTAEVVANYSILNPDTVTFAITKADYLGYNAGTTSYLVQLITSSNLPVPAGYSLRASGSITDLAGNAMDATDNTITFSAPRVPTLSTPLNGATGVGLPSTLSWSAANGAVSYRLQVSTNVGFTGIVFDSNNLTNPLTTTSYGVSGTYLTAGITYYWRVSASNAAGTSAYSVVRNFVP